MFSLEQLGSGTASRSFPTRALPGVVAVVSVIGLITGVCGLSSCQSESGTGRLRAIAEDSVLHVHSPEVPLWGLEFQPFNLVEVLGADPGERAVQFARPITVSTGPNGIRYVLDSYGPSVLLLDSAGNLMGRIGRSGEGPGEFAVPTDLLVQPDGSFAVLDPGSFRISFFNGEGGFQGMVKTEVFFSQFESAGNRGFYAYSRNRSLSGRTLGHELGETIPQVSLLDSAGATVAAFAPRHKFTGEMTDIYVNKLFLAPLPGDSLLLNYQGVPMAEVWSQEGVLARVIHRPLPFEPHPPRWNALDREPGTGPSIGYEFDILSSGLAVHPDGDVWAVLVPQMAARYRTPMFGEPEVPDLWSIELFDREGRWLSRQPLGFPCKNAVLDWGSDGLYLLNPFEDAAVYRFEFHPPVVG